MWVKQTYEHSALFLGAKCQYCWLKKISAKKIRKFQCVVRLVRLAWDRFRSHSKVIKWHVSLDYNFEKINSRKLNFGFFDYLSIYHDSSGCTQFGMWVRLTSAIRITFHKKTFFFSKNNSLHRWQMKIAYKIDKFSQSGKNELFVKKNYFHDCLLFVIEIDRSWSKFEWQLTLIFTRERFTVYQRRKLFRMTWLGQALLFWKITLSTFSKF